MSYAFLLSSSFLPSTARKCSRASCWNGQKIFHVPSGRMVRLHTTCVALNKEPNAPQEEEAKLDEKAMRAAEIHEVLKGLEDFKSRIIDDATKLAKKVRAPKKQLEAALASHPDLIKIDGHIAELQEELKNLGDR